MHLLQALNISSADEIDPNRSLQIGPYELGQEAASEAVRIITGGVFETAVGLDVKPISEAFFWAIMHRSEGYAEIFALPSEKPPHFSTAIEVAIVRAIAALELEHHQLIFDGGIQISLGPYKAVEQFQKIIEFIGPPMVGVSSLHNISSEVIISETIEHLLTPMAVQCFRNSFRSSPLKFRFLELYRVMEARFLADIKSKLISSFDTEPSAALGEATSSLKSELKQLIGLAEQQQEIFEECWSKLAALQTTNRFVAALFKRVSQKGQASGPKYQTGAALIYQIRCSIVHAGEKDMIFESFPDSELALESVLPSLEHASLLLVGIELL